MSVKIEKAQQKQRRKPKQARALAKYNAVLDACSRVLSTHSYSKITMTEFSLESGLPYATIYQYFENKDDIMIAWIVRFFDQIEVLIANQKEEIEREGQGSGNDLSNQVDGLIRTSVQIMASHQHSMRELIGGMHHLLTSRMLVVAEDRTVKLVQKMFPEAQADGANPDLEYHLRIITKMITGYYLQSILSGQETIDPEKDSIEIAFLVNSYLKGRGMVL